MCEVIDFRTRKKWPGALMRKRPTKFTAGGKHTRRGGSEFRSVGEIAASIVERLAR